MRVLFLSWVFFFLPWGFSFSLRFFFLPWGFSLFFFLPCGFSFCLDVNSFAVTVGWATVPLKFCSQRFLIFSTCGYSWEPAQTLLIWLAFIILAIDFVDWPVRKTLDIFVCQTSENKAFKTQHSVTVVHEEREHDLFSSPVSTLSARSAEQVPSTTVTTWEEVKVQVRRIHWEIRLKDDK